MDLIEVVLKTDEKVIKETLSRIGVANKKEKIIYPSCYLYIENDKYFIVHFKRLFLLERENAYDNIGEEDLLRRNAIIYCLKQWDLIDVDEEKIIPHSKFVFVLSHKEKKGWIIQHKYNQNSNRKTEDQ